MNEKKHIYYFDYLRLIAAFCVIYMHVAADALRMGISADWHLINVVTSFAFTAVPLFFMMSGYLLLTDEKTANVGILLKKRLPRLAAPLAAWTVLALVWKMAAWHGFSLSYFTENIVSALGSHAWIHFWYLYMLIAIYALSPILRAALNSLDKNGHILVLSIIALINLRTMLRVLLPDELDRLINLDIISKLTFLDGYLCQFILGYYLGNLKKKFPNAALAVSGAAVLVIIILGTYRLTDINGYGVVSPSFQNQSSGFEVLLACIIFLFFKQNFDRPVKFLTGSSVIPLLLGIYMMHNLLLSFMLTALHIYINTFADTLAFTAIIFAVCFLVMKTAATVKPLCFPLTGVPYKAACSSCNWIYSFKKVKSRKNSVKQ